VTVVLLGLDVGRSRQRLLDFVLTGHTGGVLAGDVRSLAVLRCAIWAAIRTRDSRPASPRS